MRFLLPALVLAFLCLPGFAQEAKTKADANVEQKANALKLTEGERKALEPLQQAVIEANQELAAAADALDVAKADNVLAAAWRWKAAAGSFKAALANRGNWIATTAKAKGCDGCELNLQTMELQKAKQ